MEPLAEIPEIPKSYDRKQSLAPKKSGRFSGRTVPTPPIPPDGGYGWVVVFASFFISFLVDGVCYSYGVFMVDLVAYFQTSRAKAAIVGSVLTGVYSTLGPCASGLINKFGARPVTIVGAFICLFAFSISTISPNIDILILLFGFLGGLGFSCLYLPSVVIVGFYFEKKRALATGIALCGTGVGSFVFAVIGKMLLVEYTWKGAILIVGGIAFNSAAMGALFRPLPPGPDIPLEELLHGGEANIATDVKIQINGETNSNAEEMNFLSTTSGLNQPRLRRRTTSVRGSNPVVFCSCDDIALSSVNSITEKSHMREEMAKPMNRQDVFYAGSIAKLPQYQSKPDVNSYIRSITEIPIYDETLDNNKAHDLANKLRSCFDESIGILDFSLLKSLTFSLYAFSCFLFNFGFMIVLIFIPDAAQQIGIDSHRAALALSLAGMTNMLGRLGSGWVSDQKWADCLLINAVSLTIGGAVTFALPFCFDFGSMAAYCTFFGFSMGIFNVLRTIIVVELMGLESLSGAFGLVQMAQGLAIFLSAPIAGVIFDISGTYDYSFYTAASVMLLAGLICLSLRRVAAWERKYRGIT